MRLFSILILSCLFSSLLSAQHKIEFEIKNYNSDTVIVGYYIMDKQLVLDSLVRENSNSFILQGNDTLPSGVYLVLTQPDNQYIQFLVSEKEQNFSLTFDYNQKEKIKYKNAPDNSSFQSYIEFLSKVRPKADALKDTMAARRKKELPCDKFEEELNKLNEKVKAKQQKIIEYNPGSLTALMIKANIEISIPEFSDAEDENLQRYQYYKRHYFDNVELGNPASLRTPFLFQRIEYYINKLTPNHPDSINQSLDSILTWCAPSQQTFNYYLSHYLNAFGKSKIVGYDAIYVHLVDNYYAKGLAPWVDEENLLKIIDNANLIRPVLIGKTAPDIIVYDEFNKPISIAEIDYEYLVLLFWAPDCSYCKATMPKYIEFNERWKDKGVKIFAICTKHNDKINDCWEYVKEKNMHGFINAADEFHRSRFKIKYNVQTTPKVFILDKNQEILMKNIGADQMDAVMEEIIKNSKEKME